MKKTETCDHTRGLCGKPDVPNNTPREEAEANPPHCLCCGAEMRVVDCSSIDMEQLAMYHLICTVCPMQIEKEEELPEDG